MYSKFILICYAGLTLYFQSVLLLGIMIEQLSLEAVMLAQLYLLFANLILAILFKKNSQAYGALLQLSLWSFASGPFGTIVAVGAFDWSSIDQDYPSWLESQIEFPFTGKIYTLRAALRQGGLRIEGASSTQAFHEIFIAGNLKEKLKALNVIAKRFDPSLLPILKLALKDLNAPVRVLAATVLGKIQLNESRASSETEGKLELSDPIQESICLVEANLLNEASDLHGDA